MRERERERERNPRQMDVDGLQTSRGRQTDAVCQRVCVGVFDVTPDSCVTQTAECWRTFWGRNTAAGLSCVNICISIHMYCQREVLIRTLYSKKGSNRVNLKNCVYRRGADGKHVLPSQTPMVMMKAMHIHLLIF